MIGVPTMEIQDVNVLFSRKESQNEEVASWKESTKKHLRANYLNFMADANLLTVSNKKRTITPPLMDASLEYYLKIYGESDITKAIMGHMMDLLEQRLGEAELAIRKTRTKG